MPATTATINDFLSRDDITKPEKLVIAWQFGRTGDFETHLWRAISRADESNLARLELGFPEHVGGFRAWAYAVPYAMGERLRGLGLGI
jgi:hypothetical protein